MNTDNSNLFNRLSPTPNTIVKTGPRQAEVAVIGAGIVGLAMAYGAVKLGKKVVVFERSPQAVGASIRNFGLLWPIGQPEGILFERAMRSRTIWDEISKEAGIWKNNNGSLHLAYYEDEMAVLEEYFERVNDNQALQLLTREELKKVSNFINPRGLLGGIYSTTEATVDPREAVRKFPDYLQKLGVEFRFGIAVTDVSDREIRTPQEIWHAEQVIICSGSDFETLYPLEFSKNAVTKCKLQMMRTISQPSTFNLGPTLCGGLTLTHYASFKDCKSIDELKHRFERDAPELVKWGIHVMVTQNGLGELTIGDSHEYGLSLEPFDKEEINQLILSYLNTFTAIPNLQIGERWHGIYPKVSGKTELILHPEEGVTIVNGLGGAGMTLSFGLAEEIMGQLVNK